ncbi:MAG: glycosyltransferase family 4 protein [Clostridia bacterium]
MVKILVFTNSMEAAGGIERVIANLVNCWCDKYDITLLVKDSAVSFYKINQNIKVESLNVPLFLNMKSRLQRLISLMINFVKTNSKLKKYLSSSQYDYIYVASPFNAMEVSLISKACRKQLVISEHGSKLAYNLFYQWIKKIIYPKAYCISVPTKMDTKLYSKEGCSAVYIPHLSTFQVKEKNSLNSKTVINIGRLTADKQQLMLLEIWNSLNKKDQLNGWKLRIIGKGEEESRLLNYIKMNKLEKHVEIFPPQLDIGKIYQQASLFALSSKFEGFGMVLLEAMSFGIPCISFDCPSGPRDIIEDGINGKLVPCYSIEIYECQLAELLINENNLIKKLGDNAFSTAFNWDNKKILEIWNEVFKNTTRN